MGQSDTTFGTLNYGEKATWEAKRKFSMKKKTLITIKCDTIQMIVGSFILYP